MLADYINNANCGLLTKHIQPQTSIIALLNFIERYLPEFADKNRSIDNEKGLTHKLVSLLQLYAQENGYPFRFMKDDPENILDGNSPTIDIGVYSNNGVTIFARHYHNDEAFFSFEAKRLSRKIGKAREREYVVGRKDNLGRYINTGGIERFKKGIHGKALKLAGIIGYVQDQDFLYWHTIINNWIDELISSTIPDVINWDINDKLVSENSNIIGKYRSHNSRAGADEVILYHLWVDMKKQDGKFREEGIFEDS